MNSKINLFICVFLFFFGFIHLKAQESKEIFELKNKLALAKSDSDKNEINRNLANLYGKLNKKDSLILYVNKTILYYKKVNNTEKIFNNNLILANYLLRIEDINSAELYINEAKKYFENPNDFEKKVKLNYSLGIFSSYKKKYKEAQKFHQDNIELNLNGKKVDYEYIMLSYQALFSISYVQQNYSDAYKYLNTYLDFVKKKFPERISGAYNFLGGFYMQTNDYQRALEVYKESVLIYKRNSNLEFLALANRNIGSAYYGLKKMDSAKYYLKESLSYYSKKEDAENIADVNNILSHIYNDEGEYENAEEYIGKSVELSPKNIYHKSYYYGLRINNLVRDSINVKSNPNKRIELENLVIDVNKNFEEIKKQNWYVDPDLVIYNYTSLSNAYEILGDYKKAYYYFQKAMKEQDRVYGLEKMKSLSDVQSQTEITNEKAKIKLQEETKRIQLQKEIELKALRFEFDKKQAAAKTDEERKRLLLEEDAKRREIELTYAYQKKQAEQKYSQEKKLASISQEKKDAVAKADLENSKTQKNMWAIGAGLSLLLLGFAGFSYNQKRKDNKKIAEEKQKSDDLLLNILPYEVAEELKEKGKTSAKHFDEVSVLFTDFVNFTANSERIGVQEVLNELNICFTEFDNIMEKYGLEKIKTIGDAYLAVSGLPVSNDQHAKNAVSASLEILSYIQQRKKDNPNALDIRIGIHSGPVIAGIVGVKKFAYDIWGDTVNTAARMEQNSTSGKVNVSEATYRLIKEDFTFEHRGKIETKGKGAMDMYFVSQSKI